MVLTTLATLRNRSRTILRNLMREASCGFGRALPVFCREALVRRLMFGSLPAFRTGWAVALHEHAHLLLPRCDGNQLEEMVGWARHRFSGADEYLLTDSTVDDLPFDFVAAGIVRLADATDAEHRGRPRVFYCVYESDERLIRTLRVIRSLDEAYYYTPKAYLPTARVFHRDDAARKVLQDLLPVDGNLDTYDLVDWESIIQALRLTRELPGDYVEIGVYRGASAELALGYMREAGIDRRTWLLDLFEGFTYEGAADSADAFWLGQFSSTSLEAVADRLRGFGGKSLVRCNVLTDDLPAGIERIAVCNIDVDMYEAVTAALEKVTPLMESGGMVLVEDQGHTPNIAGGYLAVRDFLDGPLGDRYIAWDLTSGQALLIRR